MSYKYLAVLVLAGAVLAGGCGRAFTEGLGVVTGAKGVTVVIKPVSNNKRDVALGQYTRFEMQPFTDAFGGKIPGQFFGALPGEFDRQLAKAKMPNRPGGKTLLIRGKIISYEDASGVMSQAFGPFEEVVARVELVDQASGNVIGVANCIGRSTQTVNQGPDKKAAGLAEAIVGWIRQHYPKTTDKDE